MGFEDIGIFKKIGYKNGKWHDTNWFQLTLAEHIINPAVPRKITELKDSNELKSILHRANESLNIP